jgi:uncharacterized protein (DUF1697 family)
VSTYTALLRGVNVGGRTKVSMKELKALFEDLGYTGVVTYIQSGNVVFDSSSKVGTKEATAIEKSIRAAFGFDVAVVVRSSKELAAVVADNPFVAAGADPSKLHVTFLAAPVPKGSLDRIDAGRYAPEEFAIGRREVYLHLPNGIGRSKLASALARPLSAEATTRNWNTVTKLLAMTQH